jgi:FkbM family methyltransferase
MTDSAVTRKPGRDRFFTPAIFSRIDLTDEALMIANHFGDRTGAYVEVGAYDPIVMSQTWQLELRGWNGLLVEPVSEQAAKLRAQRNARVAEVACGSPSQHGTLMEFQVCGIGSTLVKGFMDPEYSPHAKLRQVRCVTLDSVLAEMGLDRIDFISIDVEGAEIDVLEGFSLERYKPSLVLIEDFLSDQTRYRHLTRRGYRFVRRTGINSWYVPRDCDFHVSLLGRWQLFRKVHGTRLRAIKHRRRRRAREAGAADRTNPITM